MIRMDEIRESLHIISNSLTNIPRGNFAEKMRPVIKIPAGTYYHAVEGSRGALGVYIESKGRQDTLSPALPFDGTPVGGCHGYGVPR